MKDNKGQSILEFLVFLPLFLTLMGLIVGLGNSINGSINQQKAVRGYFFYINQNNSMVPRPDYQSNAHAGWRAFGMFFIGWAERLQNDTSPVAPCYKLPIAVDSSDSVCENSYSERTTQLIRVGSVFGLCGATYFNSGNHVYLAPFLDPSGGAEDSPSVSGPDSCTIR